MSTPILKMELENPWKTCKQYVAIGPAGEVSVRHIPKLDLGEGIGVSVVVLSSGIPAINPPFARKGWVLYEDLCLGKVVVDGKQIPGEPEKLEVWKRFVEGKKVGREFPTEDLNSSKFWHSEVIRRRQYAKDHGVSVMDSAQASAFLFGEEKAEEKPKAKGGK